MRHHSILAIMLLVAMSLGWPRMSLAQPKSYYYCEELHVYYPEVQICPQGWRQVLQPPPSKPAEPKGLPGLHPVPLPRVTVEVLPPLSQKALAPPLMPVPTAAAEPTQMSISAAWLTLLALIGGLVAGWIVIAKFTAARRGQTRTITSRARRRDADGS